MKKEKEEKEEEKKLVIETAIPICEDTTNVLKTVDVNVTFENNRVKYNSLSILISILFDFFFFSFCFRRNGDS